MVYDVIHRAGENRREFAIEKVALASRYGREKMTWRNDNLFRTAADRRETHRNGSRTRSYFRRAQVVSGKKKKKTGI